ncbi:MAG: hypothetical protein ACRCYZ_04685 [Alphaproteobacteria bacterium]
MLHRKNSVSYFVFGASLAWLGAAYAGFTQLNDVFPEQNISEAWKVKAVSKGALEKMYVVEDYPKAEGKTEANYAPKRQEGALFDCAIALKLDENQTEFLGDILNNWIKGGISAHYIMGQDGTLVEWVNPSVSKAQAAGLWNNKSVEILLLTHGDQSSDVQNGKMKDLFNYLRETDAQTDVKYLGSHSEARGSGEHGVIKNVDAMREFLGLKPLSEKNAS